MRRIMSVNADNVDSGPGQLIDSGRTHGTQAKHGDLATLFHLLCTSKKATISGGWVFRINSQSGLSICQSAVSLRDTDFDARQKIYACTAQGF